MPHILKMLNSRRAELVKRIEELGYPTGPPDFVGVGSMRCGTSWWHSLIIDHPRVFNNEAIVGGVIKEHHFFDIRRNLPITDEFKAEYFKGFPKIGWKVGEWTPCYMRYKRVPEMLYRCAPKAKIIVLLRDPIERYQSHIRYTLDHWPENLSNRGFFNEVIKRGEYFSHLTNLTNFYPIDRILILQYEKCVLDATKEIKKTFRFLGLSDFAVPAKISNQVNCSKARFSISEEFRAGLKLHYKEGVRALADQFDVDQNLWPNFR